MKFDPFVVPFNIGLYFVLLYCVARCIIWFMDLSKADKLRLQRGFFGKSFGSSLREIFMESLIHRKIFRVNPILGYMHMSLAFGWFLLILFGTIEADIFGTKHLNPPYLAIFFKFFNPGQPESRIEVWFAFLMDLILAFILSGLLIAVIKRFRSGIVGMKRTTKLKKLDTIALTALWLIFPSRLLAESCTSVINGSGSFLTASTGNFLAAFLPVEYLEYPFWWLYSLSLGTFFILLPRTRYMHIPTELFLIFLRNSGVTTGDSYGSYAETEVYSCSSCGICLNVCQMNSAANITGVQSAYFVKGLKREDDVYDMSMECLMCGRCDQACPVGIELGPLRMIQRRTGGVPKDMIDIWKGFMREQRQDPSGEPVRIKFPETYSYQQSEERHPDILYFAGCMGHLTPGITRAMETIFRSANVRYDFMDRSGTICCGRPLSLAGNSEAARDLVRRNSDYIWKSEATTLVTSCPICYRVFKESYHLNVRILHHSQYINELIERKVLKLDFLKKRVVYHDPCELGRGAGVYSPPREVLLHVVQLDKVPDEKENGFCCGGSIANIRISQKDVTAIASDAFRSLTANSPNWLVTACPLCKKSFSKVDNGTTRVFDIAEIVAMALPEKRKKVEKVQLPAKILQSY